MEVPDLCLLLMTFFQVMDKSKERQNVIIGITNKIQNKFKNFDIIFVDRDYKRMS